MNINDFMGLDRRELKALMASGHRVRPEELAGSTYEGVSLGVPAWVKRLSWTKFQKAFYRDPKTGRIRGWNIKTRDDDLESAWVDLKRGGVPRTFGHFDVISDDEQATLTRSPGGVLLDYGRSGRGGNGVLNHLRDPVVALSSSHADLLLGWSYLSFGSRVIGTPSYFLLRRGRTVDHVVDVPR